jgi:exosortase
VVSLSEDTRPARAGADAVPFALAGALLVVALAFLYLPLWSACWQEWWREDSAYSHGILIPPLALFMIWQRRDELIRLAVRPATSSLALLFMALALQLFARWAHSTMLSWASFLLLMIGGIAFLGGWRWAAYLLPPVLFLTFMVPMSKMLTQPIVFGSQMASTKIAATFLQLMGFEAQQMGTIIQMENYVLQVALACSGFKTLIALTAFAACFVYLLQASPPKKLLLFGAAMVLSLLVNGLRISLVGVSGELISSDVAQWVHDNGGLPVTALALGGLYLMARIMKCPLGGTPSSEQRRLLRGNPS